MDIVEKSSEFANPKTTYADTLLFTAYAWSKLLYMQAIGNTEVAGYCITGTTDPLLVTDFRLVKQQCSSVTFDLDENDMAEYQESILDTGLTIWQVCRILAHTHPGNCPNPSQIDEENFRKVFTRPDWAIMLIIAENGAVYCRLKINTAPGVEKLLKVSVDFSQNFGASDHQLWDTEYKDKVTKQEFRMTGKEGMAPYCIDSSPINGYKDPDNPLWWNEEHKKWIGQQAEIDRQITEAGGEYSLIDEIECNWDTDGNVLCWNDTDSIWYAYNPDEKQWYVENLNDEEDDDFITITQPNEPWVKQVVAWADENADDRDLAMEYPFSQEEEEEEVLPII